MHETNRPESYPAFDTAEGLSLAVSYLDDPSSVECPRCGPGRMQVVTYLDAQALHEGERIEASPDGDYAVILYCRGCRQGAALTFEAPPPAEDRRAA
jgi:hypothetical protein